MKVQKTDTSNSVPSSKHLEINRIFYFNSAVLFAGRVEKCCTISIYAAITL
jgi:hypothetical protein